MSRRRPWEALLPSHHATPEEVFLDRRQFLRAASAALATTSLACARAQEDPLAGPAGDRQRILAEPLSRPKVFPTTRNEAYAIPPSIGGPVTERLVAATHNNFYEFLPGRGGEVWKYVEDFQVEPWKVEITGECARPRTFDLDDLFAFAHEERLYHFRCVERWAMNVPWSGFPLSRLLAAVEPKGTATHVRFLSAHKPKEMPGIGAADYYPWPYFEGLRMDEAMHDLTLVATGVYGRPLLKQHGAPLRLVVPWKYGFKNPKSIVKIELLREEPATFWQIQPHEYGFLSNVNPNIPHPRWSQARSRWLGGDEWFDTPPFNGYGEQVAALYPDEPTTPQAPLQPGQKAR